VPQGTARRLEEPGTLLGTTTPYPAAAGATLGTALLRTVV